MRMMSSMCVGIYRCIRKYVVSGWFVILIIYNVSKPPLGCVYG
jgi:hypothetical protein